MNGILHVPSKMLPFCLKVAEEAKLNSPTWLSSPLLQRYFFFLIP